MTKCYEQVHLRRTQTSLTPGTSPPPKTKRRPVRYGCEPYLTQRPPRFVTAPRLSLQRRLVAGKVSHSLYFLTLEFDSDMQMSLQRKCFGQGLPKFV